MTWNAYFGVATLTFVLGMGLLVHPVLITGVETIERIWRRRMHPASERLRELMGVPETRDQKVFHTQPFRLILPTALSLVSAVALRDVMLSVLAILVGFGLGGWFLYRERQARSERIDDQAELLALQVRSLLPVEHSILACLKKAQAGLPSGELAQAVSRVSSRLEMKQSPSEACQPLHDLPGTVTRRLATLLAESSGTRADVQMDLLAMLEREIHHRRMLRSRIRQSLTLVKSTIRVLQGAVGAGLAATVTLPMWRAYFLADLAHRTLLIVLVCVSALASLYFEIEVLELHKGESV